MATHIASDAQAVLATDDGYRCPRCKAADQNMTLLTSMHRYYSCGRCACRWQISRSSERMHPDGGPCA